MHLQFLAEIINESAAKGKLELSPGEIKGFESAKKIGEGSFGVVHLGILNSNFSYKLEFHKELLNLTQFYFEGTFNGKKVARKMERKNQKYKVLHEEIATYRDLSEGVLDFVINQLNRFRL